MLKVKMIGAALFGVATLLVVSSTVEAAGRLDGFYVGGKVTRDTYSDDINVTATDGIDTASFGIDSLSGDGFAAALFIGYDLEVNRWHLGIEGEYGFSGADMNFSYELNGTEEVASIEARETYGATARFGYEVMNGALVYGRAGWVETKFRGNPGTSTREDGPRFGGGVELALSDQLSVRAEYLFTDYGNSTTTVTEANVTETWEESVTGEAFNLGLAVRF